MKTVRSLICCFYLILAIAAACQAQQSISMAETEKQFDAKWQEVVQAWGQKDYALALNVLESLRAFPEIEKMEQRWIAVLYGLTCAHSLLGHREEAVKFLDETITAGFSDYDQLMRDTDLDNIRNDPRFQGLTERVKALARFWDNPFIGTPYRENLGEDEKVAGLSKLWSEAKYNFVYFDRLPGLSWDSLYLAYIPKVRETKSTADYLHVLERFSAELKDGHTRVEAPNELMSQLYARPAIDTRIIENRVFVTEVLSKDLLKAGLKPGVEIITVDGVPVIRYAQEQVQPYVSTSTPQALDYLVYSLYLLCGSASEPAKLAIRDEGDEIFEVELQRKWRSFIPEPSILYRELKGGITYLDLRTFGDNKLTAAFDSLFDSIKSARALVIDVRKNTGGNSDQGFNILGYLTDTPFIAVRVMTQSYDPWRRFQGLGNKWSVNQWTCPANGTKLYKGPVVILIGPATGSAAEDFVVAFRAMKRGILIGEPTSGSTGQPIWFSLPGGIRGQVCTNRTTYPDGTEFVGVGVQPDLLVVSTAADIRLGRDRALDQAQSYLKTQMKRP